MRSPAITIIALTLTALLPAPVVAAAEPIVTSDLLRIRNVTSIHVAPSGMVAVFVVRSIAEKEPRDADAGRDERPGRDRERADDRRESKRPRYAYRSHLYLLDLNKPDVPPRQLTFGDRQDHAPRLSPDGRRIAFLRVSEENRGRRESQAWVMAVDGGEARQVTDLERGVGSPRWSPDGKLLLVGGSVDWTRLDALPPWPLERPGRTWEQEKQAAAAVKLDDAAPHEPDGAIAGIREWLADNAREENPTVITRLRFQDEQSLRRPWRVQHLFLVDVDAASDPAPSEKPYSEPRRVTDGFFDHGDAEFLPDGKRIVYAARKTSDQHPDRVHGTDLWQINVDGSNDRPLLLMPGWSLEHPLPNRDGSVVAFSAQQQDEPAFRPNRLALATTSPAPASAETAPAPMVAWLTGESAFDASVGAFEWLPSTSGLVFAAPMRGGFPLFTINSGLLEPATLVGGGAAQSAGIHAFGAGGGSIVYAVTAPDNPCVLMVRDARGERRVMDLNPWIAQRELSAPREFWVTRPDGLKVQCWLMEPARLAPAPAPGKKYPLVLEIHGGPSAMWGPGEFTMWHEFQLLCAHGYGVVYANPRGSGGYGYAFQKGNYQNWGEGPAGDVLAAVDDALARNDWIDRNRLVVTGGSYGGYLTAWIVTQDNRFKAAAAQRGVYDLPTFYGEGNAFELVEWAFGGPPFDPRVRDVIQRNNPFSHVQRIRTPLLIMHSSNDLRTGVSQSEMLYRALKSLNRPVEYVRYPDSGHDLSRTGDPTQRMDRLNRILEFFDRYVQPK